LSPFVPETRKEVGELFDEEFTEEGFVEGTSSGLEDRLEEDVDCSVEVAVVDEESDFSRLFLLGSGWIRSSLMSLLD
jgi:hypothetical protein